MATSAGGEPVGDYRARGNVLRWGHRTLRFRTGSLRRKFGWGRTRYVLSEGERTLEKSRRR